MKEEDIIYKSHIDNPVGNNNLTAYGSFYWRDLYKHHGYPDNAPQPIDMWYDDNFYGRTDSDGIPVYPSEKSVKKLTATQTVFAVNFVADAWEDLKEDFTSALLNRRISSEESVYGQLEPASGWRSVYPAYHLWNRSVYKAFTEFINPVRDRKIVDFKSFIKIYVEFIDVVSHTLPQTRESWILSSKCPPSISGLMIEVAQKPYGLDEINTRYLNDNNFKYISQMAEAYGFKIDKNVPWRFVADLESDKMKEYMKGYGYDEKTYIDYSYFRTYQNELDMFKHYMWQWYNSYVATNPVSTKPAPSGCRKSQKSMIVYQKREILTKGARDAEFSEDFWIRLYSYVRAKETRQNWKQVDFDNVVRNMLELKAAIGFNDAMRYFYSRIRGPQKAYTPPEKHFTEKEVYDILKKRTFNRHQSTFNF